MRKLAEDYKISSEQLDFWQANGYLRLPDFFDASIKSSLDTWSNEILGWTKEEPVRDGLTVLYEDGLHGDQLVWRVRGISQLHTEFREVAHSRAMMNVVEALVGSPCRLITDKLHYRFPGSHGFLPHQDSGFSPVQGRIANLAVVIAIDPADESNGGFHVAPRAADDESLLPHEEHFIRPDVVDGMEWIPISFAQGDVFVFSEHLPHFTRDNVSDRTRRSLFLLYRDLHEPGVTPEAFSAQDQDDGRR